ncbi:MAG: cache domain-containing protein [Rhodospirillales bacterium]|nr:MAG: cache domain-containing protein [Rhodospirillales bacterium]
MRKSLLIAVASIFIAPLAQAAGEHEDAIREMVDSKFRAWMSDPMMIEAIREQNRAHAGLTQAEIDGLDKRWRAETASPARPMINEVLGRPASKKLLGYKNEAEGLFTEIFVMDNRGLNVAQSDPTSDYWQGDEAKWKKTFLSGPNAVFIDEVEFDDSTQTYQAQVSVAVPDPDTGSVIGAVTIGVNVELLSN